MPTKHKLDAKWLRLHIARKGYSLRQFAKAIRTSATPNGLDPSGLQAILRGNRRVQLEEVEAISRLLEQPVAEVLLRVGLKVDLGRGDELAAVAPPEPPPVGGVVDATTGSVRFIPTAKSKAAKVIALRVEGDPFLSDWTILCEPSEVTASLDEDKAVGVVQTRDGRILLRKIRPAFAPGRYDLGPVFGFGAREDGVEVVGIIPVLGMGR